MASTESQKSKARLYVILLVVLVIGSGLGMRRFLQWRRNVLEDRFFAAAVEARKSEDWKLLREVSKRWVSENPEADLGWLALADACQQLGDLECAEHSYAQVRSDDPRYLESLAARGDLLYLELNLPFEAEKNWKLMLEKDPSSPEAHRGLISFYALSVQRNQLQKAIQQAISTGAEPKEAYVYLILSDRLSFSTGLFRIDEWLQQNEGNEVLEVARAYYLARHGSSAGTELQESNSLYQGDWTDMDALADKYPENLNVLAFKIENAIISGQFETAIQYLNRLPDASKDDHRFWRYRAQIMLEKENIEEALRSARESLELNPYDWRSRLVLAQAHRFMRNIEAANEETRIANLGKTLEKTLLSLPNPQDVWDGAIQEVYIYAAQVRDPKVVAALESKGVR